MTPYVKGAAAEALYALVELLRHHVEYDSIGVGVADALRGLAEAAGLDPEEFTPSCLVCHYHPELHQWRHTPARQIRRDHLTLFATGEVVVHVVGGDGEVKLSSLEPFPGYWTCNRCFTTTETDPT